MNIRFVNDKIHGILDYVVAIALVLVPFVLNFQAVSSVAHWFSIIAGIGLFVYSLITGYSLSARNLISFRLHLALDFIAAIAFLIVPFVFGFGGIPRTVFLTVGAAIIVLVLVTNPDVEQEKD